MKRQFTGSPVGSGQQRFRDGEAERLGGLVYTYWGLSGPLTGKANHASGIMPVHH
jgi:hypothetical protein